MPALGLGLGLALDSGAGNPEGLSLDLQFATDKSLVARKGPTPTFTRASTATQVGSTGLIEYAPENLALQSENFGTTWANNTGNALTLNDALSPTETLTADRIDFPATAAAGLIKQIQQSFSGAVAGNGPVTASVWLRTVSGASTVYLTLLDGGAPWQRVHVACNVTTAWTRFSVTLNTPTLSLFMTIGPDTRTTNGTPAQPAVQDAASVYAWGAQLERSSTARTYIPTTTAAVYGARFDHDPVTLASKGLLIEESRTNLALQSENHPSATWNKTGLTVASAGNTDPAGAATSNLVSEDSSVGLHRLFQSTTYVSGTSYSISVFLKYAGRQFVALNHPVVAANGTSIFDIQNGTITLSGSSVTSSITAYPNGWYRCVVNGVSSTTGGASHIIQGSTTGGILTGSYLGLNGAAFYIYGSQVEAGAFPTSYIPTTTASVVRSADVCSITGSDFTGFTKLGEGTVVVHGDSYQGTTPAFCQFSNDSGGARSFTFLRNTSTGALEYSDSGSGVIIVAASPSYPVKFGAARDQAAGVRLVYNGIIGTASAFTTNGAQTRMLIGNSGIGLPLNGCIRSIKHFKKRLSNTKLQTLTAP